ncbi:hypothetical protein NMG60_11022781 [Bertholletia excelsa]
MGMSRRRWKIILMMVFCMSLCVFTEGMHDGYFDSDSLDEYVRQYASRKIKRIKTGLLYNISLPANFSGLEVSVLRLRSRRFYLQGANYSSFHIPPKLLPYPWVKRFDLIYQNLGNWSSHYFKVPNYTLVAPVVGFMAYSATNTSIIPKQNINFCCSENPILVSFNAFLSSENGNSELKCVRFAKNGVFELSNMTQHNVCVAQANGHFSIVKPSPNPQFKKKEKLWRWWVIGFGVGIGGLALLSLVVVLVYKFVRRKKMKEMEKEADRGEALETMWVGEYRMPSASPIRTQPVLENDRVP